MSNGVILVAHGKYAEGVKSGLDLVVGEMPNLKVVNFVEGDTYDTIDESLKEAFKSLNEYENIFILTDLKGGTPFNRSALLFGDKENVRVLSGMNFGLSYQALMSDNEDIDASLEEIIESGKESIDYFEFEKNDNTEESDGDGI